ncbi:MAG: PBP1A family penicillin-binding protein, partial [Candidatus Acidiferrales bacterium]
LGLAGANSAAPIWAEFMKSAQALPAYHNMQDFPVPPGIVTATVDPESGDLATPECPTTRAEVFIAGTEPTQFCPLHGGQKLSNIPPVSWLSHLFGKPSNPQAPVSGQPAARAGNPNPNAAPTPGQPSQPAPPGPAELEKKKGLFQKIFGIFGDNKKPPPKPKPPQT